MIFSFNPDFKEDDGLKLLKRFPEKRKDEHKKFQPLRFDTLRPMTIKKSDIVRLTLLSHPGKAIVQRPTVKDQP